MNKEQHKHIPTQGLQVPTDLEFKKASNGLFECNGKLVQIISSLAIEPEDNPPADLVIHGIGKYRFYPSDGDIVIFSFVNIQDHKTDCAVIPQSELLARLSSNNQEEGEINLKLIASDRGLHECHNIGGEGFFIALWIDDSRDYTRFHNNWSVFY